MEGKEIFNELVSKRDYTGSTADEYAQLLFMLLQHLGDDLYSLLEKASNENKRLAINPEIENSSILIDEYAITDVVFV